MAAKVSAKAPNLQVSTWVQGEPTNIDKERGNVVLIEVFQVNCPGCFLYGIPEAINLYKKYKDKGLTVLGLATAFEDFDKNNLENLNKLITTGEVIGETYRVLSQYGRLKDGNKLPYDIPFPVGMDLLHKETGAVTDNQVMDFMRGSVPDFRSYGEKDRQVIVERIRQYLTAKEYSARTFEEYSLRGTPSSILVDREGVLRSTFLGSGGMIESAIEELIKG